MSDLVSYCRFLCKMESSEDALGGRRHIVPESFLIKEEVNETNLSPSIDTEEVGLREKANLKAEGMKLEDVDEELDEYDKQFAPKKEVDEDFEPEEDSEDEDDPAKNVDSKDELWQEMKGFNGSKKNEVRGYN